MKIIFFSFGPLSFEGGIEKYITDMSNSFANKGHKVCIFNDSFFSRILNLPFLWKIAIFLTEGKLVNTSVQYVERNLNRKINVVNLHFINSFFRKNSIRKILHDADIVYCKNEFLDTTYYRWFIGRKFIYKTVVGVHTAVFLKKNNTFHSKIHNILYFGSIYRKTLEQCKAIHVLNSSDAEKITNKFGISKSKIFYIPIGLEEKEFHSNILRKDTDGFRILFAGRLTEQKGVDSLEELINLLNRSHHLEFKKMEFVIAGNGYQDYIAKRLAEKFDNVKFLGFVEDKNRLYRDIDITIILSRYETVSYIALESQCRGIPVITFDIPGPQDIVLSGQTGILVPPGDIQQFKNDVIKFYTLKMKKREEFFDMKQATFEKARERFGMNNVINKIESMFQNHSQTI